MSDGTSRGGAFRYPYQLDTILPGTPLEEHTPVLMDRDRALEDYLTAAAADTFVTVAASDTPESLRAAADYLCDGSADQAEIQAAIDFVSESAGDMGGKVLLLPGTFNMTGGVTMDAWGVHLVGSGRSATYLLCTGSGYAVRHDSEHGLVAHMSIESDHADGGALSFESTNDCLAFDCYLLQNSSSATVPAVVIGGTGSSITNCHVVGDETGVQLNDGWDAMVVANNYIEADTAVVLDRCEFSVVQGNILRGASSGDSYAVVLQGAKDNTVTGNSCFRYGTDGILVQTVSAETADRNNIQGNTLRADGGGTGYGIRITAGSDNLVANNDLFDSGASGEFLDGGTDTRGTGGLVSSGVTSHDDLDDVSADDHHSQVHTLTGSDHTASGLTSGHVLRATGATTFAFGAIQDADLPSTITRDTELAAHEADTTSVHGIADTSVLATDTDVSTAVSDHAAAADPHTGYLKESVVDAKGDLIVASAADTVARLAVGTDGQVLTADSGETAGVKWADASGGGGGSGAGLVPYFIPSDETYTVPEYRQALFIEPIDVEGVLDVEGLLIEVTQAPDLSTQFHMQTSL